MVKVIAIVSVLLVLIAGIVGGIVYYASLPKNAVEQLEYAKRVEKKNNGKILKLKTGGKSDPQAIEELEDSTDAAFQEVITKYPESPEAEESEYILIERDRTRGKLEGRALIERYQAFMEKYPESERNADITLKIAKIYDDDLDLKGEAIRIYQEFVEKYPEDERAPEALFEIAKIQEKLKEFEAAEKTYSQIIEEYPDSELAAEAQYRRGNVRAEELDKKKEAMEDFEEVEKKDPDSKRAKVARSRRQEVARSSAAESQEEATQEYYGAEEYSFMSMPLQDWNDPTVTVIREQNVDSLSYEMDVALDPKTSGLEGDLYYRCMATSQTLDDQFIVQFNGGMNIESITQNDNSVSWEAKGNFLHMGLAEPMKPGEEQVFHFVYSGTADDTWKGDVITEDGTYLRPESRWYPYTSWGDEYSAQLDITVPKGITAIGPGLLTNTDATSDTVTFSWNQEIPISILALVANEYEKKERPFADGRVLLQAYIYPEHEEFLDLYLDEMESILAYYETLFGEFPYKKMAVAEIPFFPGGYGSPTLLMITEMVFNNRKKVVAEFLAHEISHQWFGNLLGLTLEEDSHPWLSEGFATYVDALYIEHKKGDDAFTARVRDMASLFIESLVAFEDVAILDCLWDNPMYRTVVYEKGGLVLHTLRFAMGDEKFFAAMRTYIERFAHKSVTVSDFQETMEEYHGESLDWWVDQWLKGTGYPHYYLAEATANKRLVPGGGTENPDSDSSADGADQYKIEVTVQQIVEMGEKVFEGPLEIKITGDGEGEEHRERIWHDSREQVVEVSVPFVPTKAIIDPDSFIFKYPKIDDLEEEVRVIELDTVE